MASLASRVEHPNTNNIPLTLASLQLHTREPLVITDQRLESDSKVQGMRSNGDDRQSICKSRREWMSRHQVRNHWRESGIERITYSKSLLDWCSWLMSKCLLHCSSLHLLFFLNIPLKLNRTDCFTWICWKMKAISFWSWTPIGELESMDCMSLWKSIAVKDIPWDVLFRCLVYLRVELPLPWRCIDLMSSWEFSISFSLSLQGFAQRTVSNEVTRASLEWRSLKEKFGDRVTTVLFGVTVHYEYAVKVIWDILLVIHLICGE